MCADVFRRLGAAFFGRLQLETGCDIVVRLCLNRGCVIFCTLVQFCPPVGGGSHRVFLFWLWCRWFRWGVRRRLSFGTVAQWRRGIWRSMRHCSLLTRVAVIPMGIP